MAVYLGAQHVRLRTDIDYGEHGIYPGPYVIIPKTHDQILHTYDLIMKDNTTVKKIPYAEVTNPIGGLTVTIGG